MSVVTIQLGQCGNQIGTSLFSYLSQDALQPAPFTSQDAIENIVYKQQVYDGYFTEQQNGSLEAKSVMVDMEPKVIAQCKQKAKLTDSWRYPDHSSYIQQKGSGNNWALGYYGNGPKAESHILELARKEVEKCDHFTGFLILMSLAGGTGSGLGAYITNIMRDSFPEAIIGNHIVWPHSSGEVIVQNYNSLLTLSHLQNSADVIMVQQNDHVFQICSKLLGMKNVSFEDMNSVLAHKLASVFQPAYNDSNIISPLYDLVQSVGCHPSYKLVSIKNIPHMTKTTMEYATYVWPGLLKHLRQMLIADAAMEEGVNWEIKVPHPSSTGDINTMRQQQHDLTSIPKENFNKSLANLLILRGKELHHADTQAFQLKQLYSKRINSSFNYNEWRQPRCFSQYQKSATLVSNSQTFIRPLDHCIQKAWNMFNARAYVHQYEKYGLTPNDLIDSFGVVEQVLHNYSSI